jgi:hypothetical protein
MEVEPQIPSREIDPKSNVHGSLTQEVPRAEKRNNKWNKALPNVSSPWISHELTHSCRSSI